jgi:hypothetical protein
VPFHVSSTLLGCLCLDILCSAACGRMRTAFDAMLCVNVCLWPIHVLVLYCILLSFGILSFRTYNNNLCLCCSNLG